MIEEQLFPGEKIFLSRIRAQVNRDEYGRAFGVSGAQVGKWEHGEDEQTCPEVHLRGLFPHEHYTILRLRSKMTVKTLSKKIGLSQSQISRIERGITAGKRIKEFWGR